MEHHRAEFSLTLMCKVLGVARSGFYAWRQRGLSARQREDEQLSDQIKTLFIEQRCRAGTRTIKRHLAHQNQHQVSRRRVGRLMEAQGLICQTRRRFKVTTDTQHTLPVAPNRLNRQFEADRPDQCYVGDITYIPTQQGWLYLAIVLDLFSRQIVGWAMESHMKASLVNNALAMALWRRKPPRGLLWHTDQGRQYASQSHRKLLARHHITQSMSRKGDCWDNAVAESFFHSLKTELVHHRTFQTKKEAKQCIFEYIEVFYNRVRLHSANDYRPPVEYEKFHGYSS
jgi:transposase InsO family protein